MSFEFYAHGGRFQKRAPLGESIRLMQLFSYTIDNAVEVVAPSYFEEIPFGNVSVYLDRPSIGSLDFSAMVEFVGATVAAQPELIVHMWDAYNKSSNLIQSVTEWFDENGCFPTINIVDSFSPVFIFNKGNGDITVSKNVHDISVKNREPLRKMANKVKTGIVDEVDIVPHVSGEVQPLIIDKNNWRKFKVPQDIIFEKEFVNVACNIYRLNTRTANGRLELLDSKEKVSFEIISGSASDYIEALKHSSVLVRARRKISKNALGEESVQRLFLAEIVETLDDSVIR